MDATNKGLIAPTGYDLYVVEVSATLTGGGAVAITFSSLPTGTYAIAYGQLPKDANGKIAVFDTPITQAGLEKGTSGGQAGGGLSAVPVPPSALLLGIGGLGLALLGFNRRRQALAA
jgi:hypothetical protein